MNLSFERMSGKIKKFNRNYFIYYENGEFVNQINLQDVVVVFKKIDEEYIKKGLDWRKDLRIRIYQVKIEENGSDRDISIYRINNTGKLIDLNSNPKNWGIFLQYKKVKIIANIFDNTDITIYVLWEEIQKALNINLQEKINEIQFKVSKKDGKITSKSKLVVFFSRKENCGRKWKYSDLNIEMEKENLKLVGRGIEGERPREFRYVMGYDFRTNEKDKNVPDGYCYVGSPFPFGKRNERRDANIDLNKEDWSELLLILQKNKKRLRCKSCGLFEGETNRIGQKTKFQKGHLLSHLSGGSVAKSNIFSICQYCNTEQLNMYDIDKMTGKKIWNLIPAISKRDYKTKLDIYYFLIKHLKKEDLIKS